MIGNEEKMMNEALDIILKSPDYSLIRNFWRAVMIESDFMRLKSVVKRDLREQLERMGFFDMTKEDGVKEADYDRWFIDSFERIVEALRRERDR